MTTIIKRRKKFSDSFTNATYKLGLGTDNPLSHATYSLNNLLSRDRTTLEAGYRSSWLIGQAVDTVAEDMTKMGIDMFSKMSPDDIKKLQVCINDYSVWESYCQIIKWARLYGGALGVIIIDGADYSKPMNLEAIGKDSFKGLLVLDRWMCEPVLTELIEEFGKDFAKPKYYRIHSSVANLKLPNQQIHYSRIMRFDGVSLPFYQRIYENHWGLSVVERIYDRLISYDSATLGASQLMYKSFLRVVGINGLREALAMGGKEESAIIKMFEMIRQYQSNEGITLLDKDDQFGVTQNSGFGGAADLLRQFSEQISGATGIPLVRLFGQSPSGFSTGDSDLRNYYDNINREQENKLRPHLTKLLEIICKSKLGKALPEDFEYKFVSLWQMSDKEKSEIATSDVAAISSAFGGGLVTKEIATKELLQLSRTTGRFTNITEQDIEKAKEEDANQPPPGMTPEENPMEVPPAEGQNEGMDLTTKNPEAYQEQSIKSPLKGREESINAREQETQRDEIEIPTLPIKQLSEVISTNVMKNNSIIANVKNVIGERFKEAAKAVFQKFFSKDKGDFKETEHPRAKSGKHAGEFTKKGTNGGNTSESSIKKEIQQAPDNVKGMEKSRKEAQDRIKQWKESGMTDEEILYDGYRWREFVKRSPDSSWDWAVWEQIQQLAQEKGFEYKENLTEEDIFNDPKMPMDDLEREIPKADEETTNYRNNNNKNKIISYLKTPEGEKYTKISQRKIWGLVSSNEGKEIISHKSGSGATRHFESYSPFKGMENLLKAKSFKEALNTNITVYRGITDNYATVKSNLTSYTTCPEIAKLFAEGYFHNYNSPGTGKVITREVKLKDIKGFINNDGEYEVLLNIPKKEQIVSDGIKNQEEDWLNFLHKFKNKQVEINANKE